MGLYAGDVGRSAPRQAGKGGFAPVLILGALIAIGAILEVVMKSRAPTTNGADPRRRNPELRDRS